MKTEKEAKKESDFLSQSHISVCVTISRTGGEKALSFLKGKLDRISGGSGVNPVY